MAGRTRPDQPRAGVQSQLAEITDGSSVVVEINGDARTFIIKNELDRQTTVAPKWRVFEELEKNDALRRGVVMEITGPHWRRKRRDFMVTDVYPRILDPKAGKLL